MGELAWTLPSAYPHVSRYLCLLNDIHVRRKEQVVAYKEGRHATKWNLYGNHWLHSLPELYKTTCFALSTDRRSAAEYVDKFKQKFDEKHDARSQATCCISRFKWELRENNWNSTIRLLPHKRGITGWNNSLMEILANVKPYMDGCSSS